MIEWNMWNIGWIARKRATLSPKSTAIIYEDKPISYTELNANVNRTANFFKEKKLRKGDRVSFFLRNCPEFFEVLFAAAKMGIVCVPINSRLTGREIKHQINHSGSRLLVFHDSLIEAINPVRSELMIEEDKFICVTSGDMEGSWCPEWAVDYQQILKNYNSEEPRIDETVGLDDPVAIMYTSGVTGTPKGAVVSHLQTTFKCFQVILYMDMRENDIFLTQLPFFHSGGLFGAAIPVFCRGATLIVRKKFEPAKFPEDIEKYNPTIIFALTAMWKLIFQTEKLDAVDLSSARVVIGGGEKTPLNMFDKLVERKIYAQQVYGQTENSLMMMLPKEDIQRKKGSIGKPGFFTEVWVEDNKGNRMPPGEIGEIVAKGPNVMSGYWKMPDATKEAIIDGVLHTGDLGYEDEDGYFYMVDRAKDTYRSGGENVYPAEIEKVLLENPDIFQAAIIGVPDEKWGETGKALIVLNEGVKPSKKEIIKFLQGKVARYKFPKYIEFIDEMPFTASGKIKKGELNERYGHTFDK